MSVLTSAQECEYLNQGSMNAYKDGHESIKLDASNSESCT